MGPLVGREAGGEASNGPWGEAWRRGCVGALWNTSVCWTCACGRREAGTGLWGEASCREETEGDLEADQKTQARSALEEADECASRRPAMWGWRRQQRRSAYGMTRGQKLTAKGKGDGEPTMRPNPVMGAVTRGGTEVKRLVAVEGLPVLGAPRIASHVGSRTKVPLSLLLEGACLYLGSWAEVTGVEDSAGGVVEQRNEASERNVHQTLGRRKCLCPSCLVHLQGHMEAENTLHYMHTGNCPCLLFEWKNEPMN